MAAEAAETTVVQEIAAGGAPPSGGTGMGEADRAAVLAAAQAPFSGKTRSLRSGGGLDGSTTATSNDGAPLAEEAGASSEGAAGVAKTPSVVGAVAAAAAGLECSSDEEASELKLEERRLPSATAAGQVAPEALADDAAEDMARSTENVAAAGTAQTWPAAPEVIGAMPQVGEAQQATAMSEETTAIGDGSKVSDSNPTTPLYVRLGKSVFCEAGGNRRRQKLPPGRAVSLF